MIGRRVILLLPETLTATRTRCGGASKLLRSISRSVI